MENHKRPSATVLFIFGGSGDLNFRKLPLPYIIFLLITGCLKNSASSALEERNILIRITGSDCWMESNNSAEEKMLPTISGRIFPAYFLFENGC